MRLRFQHPVWNTMGRLLPWVLGHPRSAVPTPCLLALVLTFMADCRFSLVVITRRETSAVERHNRLYRSGGYVGTGIGSRVKAYQYRIRGNTYTS